MANSNNFRQYHKGQILIYIPWYQFVIRMGLGVLTVLYFYFLPQPPLALSYSIIAILFVVFFSFHIIWWLYFKRKGVGIKAVRAANWIDLLGSGTVIILDPFPIPPTLVLIVIAVIGNGIQHGLRNFIIVSGNALFVSLVAVPMHYYLSGQWPSYPFYFLCIFLLVCLHYIYFLVRGIEHLKSHAEELARKDELTGLLNRRAFLSAAGYLLSLYKRTKLPLVFVFADLDGFKAVNDELGHAMGDKVLQQFAVFAKESFRKTDITSRFGGDEFVFLLANSFREDAENVMKRLTHQFVEWARKNKIQVGLSWGIEAVGAENGEAPTLEEIMKKADEALYTAKRRRKATAQ